MNQKELKELIEFLIEKDIAEFELERGDVKVRIKRGVEPLHNRAEITMVHSHVGAASQIAVCGGLGQPIRIGSQSIEGVYAGVQVMLDLVKVAVVGVRDFGRDVAFADTIDVLG